MDKKLKDLLKSVEKTFGEGSVLVFDEEKEPPKVEVIPTGIFSLDKATGMGGLPRGRMVEIFGQASVGKSTLALYLVAAAQQMGGLAAYVDVEHSLDISLAKKLGVKTDKLLFSQPDSAESTLDLVEHLARSGDISVIVVDSVAALVPQVEVEGEMGESGIGLQARLLSKACRKLTPVINKTNTMIVWLNQMRSQIGVFFGNPMTTTGGNALKFYCSMRLEVNRGETLKEDKKILGHVIRVNVVKNKLAIPFVKTEFPLVYGEGIDLIGDVVDYAIGTGVIDKSGAHFSFNGDKIGHGRDATVTRVAEDESLLKQIMDKVNEPPKKD